MRIGGHPRGAGNQPGLPLAEASPANRDLASEDVEIGMPTCRYFGHFDLRALVQTDIVEMHIIAYEEGRIRSFGTEEVAPLVGRRLRYFAVLDARLKISGMRPHKNLQHSQIRVRL